MKVNVPLSVDAGFKINLFAGIQIPVRVGIIAGIIFLPGYFLAINLPGGLVNNLFILSLIVFATAVTGFWEKEGIWIGTFYAYRAMEPYMPRLIRQNQVKAAHIKLIKSQRGEVTPSVGRQFDPMKLPGGLGMANQVPRLRNVADSLFERKPGGWSAIVEVEGPDAAPGTEWYASWALSVIRWISGMECPAQIYCEATNYDRTEVEAAFDGQAHHNKTVLLELERTMAGDVADRTLIVRNYVVFMPGRAGQDGMPYGSSISSRIAPDTTRIEAERVLDSALRLGAGAGLRIARINAEFLTQIVSKTVLGSQEVRNCEGMTVVHPGWYQASVVVTKLPPNVFYGNVIQSIMRARIKGAVSMYFAPVPAHIATKHLRTMRANYQMMLKSTPDDVEARMMLGQMEQLHANLAGRQTEVCRMALGFLVTGETPKDLDEQVEKLRAQLASSGLYTVRATAPGLLPTSSLALGGIPLRRSLILTTHEVVAALLPIVGTPFGDHTQPLVGVNVNTGAPIYLDVWKRANHNCVIVGTSGAGKSVACKTLIVRHVLQGSRAIIIDPDSEYRPIVTALGGQYVELGEASLNALGVGPNVTPDDAAEWVVPLLSIMGGEEKTYDARSGRPIRQLNDADKAWMFSEVASFFREWRQYSKQEPVLSDFIEYLKLESLPRSKSFVGREERLQDIMLRLSGYTQGKKGKIFNQPTSFDMNAKISAIGLKTLALQFRADLTPALAFCLSSILNILSQRKERLIIMVDEAHRVTSDPDASIVLDQVVRQARKYGGGVWMASQQVDDFLSTELGKTLASNAGTKLILGVEEAVSGKAQEAFGLSAQEMSTITPRFQSGRGILISGAERATIQVTPGQHLMKIVHSDFRPDAA